MGGSGKMDEPNTTFGNQEARFEGENKSDAHERERSREALRCLFRDCKHFPVIENEALAPRKSLEFQF